MGYYLQVQLYFSEPREYEPLSKSRNRTRGCIRVLGEVPA